jgi:hypothetical protein
MSVGVGFDKQTFGLTLLCLFVSLLFHSLLLFVCFSLYFFCSCVLVVFVLFLVSVGSCYGGLNFNGTDDRRTKHAAKEQEEADRVNGGGVNGGGGRRDRTTKRPSQREKVVDEEEEEEEWTDDEVAEEEWGFEDEGWIDVLAR